MSADCAKLWDGSFLKKKFLKIAMDPLCGMMVGADKQREIFSLRPLLGKKTVPFFSRYLGRVARFIACRGIEFRQFAQTLPFLYHQARKCGRFFNIYTAANHALKRPGAA